MEELPYWIIDNKLIFKPDFNDELDNYYDIMSQHNELIFSNYNNPETAIKTNIIIIQYIKITMTIQNLIKK